MLVIEKIHTKKTYTHIHAHKYAHTYTLCQMEISGIKVETFIQLLRAHILKLATTPITY